jgi:arylsulfatase A-like enzyme
MVGGRAPDFTRTGGFLRLGAWCGLLSGAVTLGVLGARHFTGGLVFVPLETVWREPLAAVVSMTLVALVFSLGRRAWPRLFSWQNLAWVELTLVAFAGLLFVPRLHWAASAVLSAGIGFRVSRWLVPRQAALGRVMRATLVPGLALVLAAMVAVPGFRAWRDRRALQPFTGANAAPNVLVIILDTVRSWNLTAYGYPRPTTPELARLSERGVLFTRAISPAPWTLPSHASFFTGRWPHELSTDWFRALDDRYPTLAEVLGSQGYLTAGFCSNVKYCSWETGLARGFDHYEDYLLKPHEYLMAGPLHQFLVRVSWVLGAVPDEDEEGKRRDAPRLVDSFVRWLDRSRGAGTGQPFFAFLNFFDAHRPYTSPVEMRPPFLTPGAPFTPNLLPRSGPRREWDPAAIRGSMDAYDASIAFADRELGRLVRELADRDLLDNTIVVVTSDHGEEFAEHGMIGHANSLYRASLMIPLVITAPGLVPAARIDAPVTTRDLPRTILDLLPVDDAGAIAGRSLARYWQPATAGGEHEPVYSTLKFGPTLPEWYPVSNGPVRSVVLGRWRYIVQQDGSEELYDFDGDSLETANLIATDTGRVVAVRLRALLDSATGPGGSR